CLGVPGRLRRRSRYRDRMGTGAADPPPAGLHNDRARRPRHHQANRPGHRGQPLMWRIIQAGPSDVDALSQVIADAFHDLPPAHWLIADPHARRKVFPAYFRIFVDHAMTAGLVHTTPDRAAMALWLPVSKDGPHPPGDDYDDRLTEITGPW